MIFKKLVHALSLFFLLGAGLLSFFLILSGARKTGTLSHFYWFKAETQGFNSAPATTRWYNYDWCGLENGINTDCSSHKPAQAFSPRDNFGSSPNMPSTFLNNRDTYYYLSRVAWAMLLVGFFFLMMTIIPLAINMFKIISGVAIFTTVASWLALFFMLLAACLYTGCYVKARRAFHHDNRSASLGAKNFGLIWTTVFLLLFNVIATTVTTSLFRKNRQYRDYRDTTPGAYGVMDPEIQDNNMYPPQERMSPGPVGNHQAVGPAVGAPRAVSPVAGNLNRGALDTPAVQDTNTNNGGGNFTPTRKKKLFTKVKHTKQQQLRNSANEPPEMEQVVYQNENIRTTT